MFLVDFRSELPILCLSIMLFFVLQHFSPENAPSSVIASRRRSNPILFNSTLKCAVVGVARLWRTPLKDIFLVLCVSLRHVGFIPIILPMN